MVGRAHDVVQRWSGVAGWLLLLLALVDWIALKRGVAPNPPLVLAVLVAASLGSFLVRLLALAVGLRSQVRRRLAVTAEMLVLCGVSLALGAGMANWLLGLQGFVVLDEGASVGLDRGRGMDAFEAGPLARRSELDLVLTLTRVDLVTQDAGGSFYPRSHLLVRRGGAAPVALEIFPGQAAGDGALRFYQGAFGFAPRIVVTRGGTAVFDEVVPFGSELRGPRGIAFEARFLIEDEGLEVRSAIDLSTLDEALRGHPTLELAVSSGGELLGSGSLLPGHFADLERGYAIGFAGLNRWSEVVVARRDLGRWVIAGGVVALVGAVVWPLAWWRRR